jgi:phosphoenolpyruvate carboxykinase (GTP)
MGDYFQHWFDMGDKLKDKAPKVFYVNWFRKSSDGKFLWPGFGDNSRAIKWMCERVDGKAKAKKTAIGYVPEYTDLDLRGLNVSQENVKELLRVDAEAWKLEIPKMEKFFAQFGDKLPKRLRNQFDSLKNRLG